MSAREYLYAVVESALGTPKTTPVLNTDAWYFNLPDSDSFSGVMSPNIQEIPYGGGCDVSFDAVNDQQDLTLNWKGFVYPARDNFLINLFLARINAGQTAPWTTTEPVGDLASASFYKSWKPRATATHVRKRYAGCKGLSLDLSATRQDPKLRFSAVLRGQKEVGNPVDASSDPDDTEFPAPSDTQLPTGPYLFSHSATNLSVGGSAVTNYQSLSIRVQNSLDVLHFENKFASVISMYGRRIEVTFQRLLASSPNYRGFFQEVVDKATFVEFDNGTNSFKIDLGAKCHLSAYAQQLAIGREFLETITIKGRWSAAAGTDCTLTFT